MSGTRTSFDVVIVGAGVIGLTVALELRRRLGREGRLAVLDCQQPGREASWAGAGIIPAGDLTSSEMNTFAARSRAHWPALSAELLEATGIDNGYHECGAIQLCASADHAAQEQARWKLATVPTQSITVGLPESFASQVRHAPNAAYLLPTTAQVRNPWHLRALQASVCRQDQIIAGARVTGFTRSANRLVAVQTEQGEIPAGQVVIAAGAWTSVLFDALPLAVRVPEVEPVRGQIVLLQIPSTEGWCIVELGKRYLVPRRDGRVLIGSTEERVGFQKETTPEGFNDLLRFAIDTVPKLRGAIVEQSWAGLRPSAKRGRACIGPVPGVDNLFVATGHFRAGLSLSPATAKLLADQISDQTPDLPARTVEHFAV